MTPTFSVINLGAEFLGLNTNVIRTVDAIGVDSPPIRDTSSPFHNVPQPR